MKTILIATLGSEPQVVTAAIDLLEAQGETLTETWVIHTAGEPQSPVQSARQVLERQTNARFFPIRYPNGATVQDVDSQQAAEASFTLLYQLIQKAKQMDYCVHLCIAGGRKTMSVYGMAAAQLLFDENDRLWHLFSTGEFLTSKRLHPNPQDNTRLVAIPLILWSQITPAFWNLKEIPNPFDAVERIRQLQWTQKTELARLFIESRLTPKERKVVTLLVTQGLSDQEIAEELYLSPRTVEQHLRSAYRKAADFWNMPGVSRTQLVTLLHLYFATKLGENPQDELTNSI